MAWFNTAVARSLAWLDETAVIRVVASNGQSQSMANPPERINAPQSNTQNRPSKLE
jgi:hypothetical protein